MVVGPVVWLPASAAPESVTLSSGLPPCPEEATSVSGREVEINVVFVCNYSLKKERE